MKVSRIVLFLAAFSLISKVNDDHLLIDLFCLYTVQQIHIMEIVDTSIQIAIIPNKHHWIAKALFPLTQSFPLQPNGISDTQHTCPELLNDESAAIIAPPITA